jgi:predicted transcriptional regulator of viral defense system
VPVNEETASQAQARQDRADSQAETATAAAANSTVSASLVRQLDGLRPLAVDVAGGQLESAGVISRLEDGREVVVDLADIRKALAVEPSSSEEQVSEAAE